MALVVLMVLGTLVFLVLSLVRSMANEHTPGLSRWMEFGLGLSLMVLFLLTWVAHGITEWQVFTDEQREHGQSAELGDFIATFGQATLENWQSEFLQLFSFVVLAGLYMHKGSAESKDGEDKIEASLRRIEESLGTLPDDAPTAENKRWRLPDTPLKT